MDVAKTVISVMLANSHPKLRRGMVWCVTCGRSQTVNSVHCFRTGWPMCCGATMTLDSPEERTGGERG